MSRRRARISAAALVLIAGVAGLAARPAARATAATCAAPGRVTIVVRSGDLRRTAVVHVPATHAAGTTPLVVALHGYHGNGAQMERYSGFDALADRAGFVVAYPTSAGTFWNSDAVSTLPDDVAFLKMLIARLRARLCVDPHRVFLAGVSNGGGMAALAACRMSGELAGFASVAGGYDGQPACRPRRPLPLLEIHGTADPIAPYFGAAGAPTTLGVPPFVAGWLRLDRCAGAPRQQRLTRIAMRLRWSDCTAGVVVEHIRITGGGHQWPGATPPDPGPRAGFSAAAEIWRFFAGIRGHRRLAIMRSMSSPARLQRLLLVMLLALLAAIAVVLITGRAGGDSAPAAARHSPFDGPTLPPGLRAADFTLTDQRGHPVVLHAYRGHVVVLTFIHSKCKDACPFMVEQIKGALNLLGPRARRVAVLGVSVEPSEDTPTSRRAFLAAHEMDGRLDFLSGSLARLRQVWRAYAIQPVQGPVDHSVFVLLIDRHGVERVGWPADELTPEGLAHDLRVLLGAQRCGGVALQQRLEAPAELVVGDRRYLERGVAMLGADHEVGAIGTTAAAQTAGRRDLERTDLPPAQPAENPSGLAGDVETVAAEAELQILLTGLERGDPAEVGGPQPECLGLGIVGVVLGGGAGDRGPALVLLVMVVLVVLVVLVVDPVLVVLEFVLVLVRLHRLGCVRRRVELRILGLGLVLCRGIRCRRLVVVGGAGRRAGVPAPPAPPRRTVPRRSRRRGSRPDGRAPRRG